MVLAQYLTLSLFIVAALLLYFLVFKNNSKRDTWHKVFGAGLIVAYIILIMLDGESFRQVVNLNSEILQNKALTFFAITNYWCLNAVVLLIGMYPFFKSEITSGIIKYFGTIVSFFSIAFLTFVTRGNFGAGVYNSFSVQPILLAAIVGLVWAYSFITLFNEGFKMKKNQLWGLFVILFLLLATIPNYMLKALFGNFYVNSIIDDFTQPHRWILYLSVIVPIIVFVALRKRSYETKRWAMIYISLGTMISFLINYKFSTFAHVTNLPLHLCNTAMIIIPLCLVFKWDKLFYFTYFINVFGAFIAMYMPNYAETYNMFSDNIVQFYTNHFCAFFMPILIVALQVYKRPKLKQFIYSCVGFLVYFVLILFINAWFSNYGTVDYFFLNSDFVADKLGRWAENTRKIVWTFSIGSLTFTFYPLYQFLFYLVYNIIALAVWFVYEWAYGFGDTVFDLIDRKKKIRADILALEASKAKEGATDMEENQIVLKLNNFSKRYGKSKTYAVKDASLEVHGGEVFGFLGHNGAGKSTIIKSIVGIQPITDGSISVCGYDIAKEPIEAKRNIGFVPDQYALYEKLTGREYVNYIADLYKVSKEQRDEAIDKYVKLFELEGAFDNQIKTYSHGMKQKITIISALIHDPKVWILDEPLTGLDPTSVYQVKECMRQHAKKGNIVFFSSHLIDIVDQVCDKVAIIKKGKILMSGNVKDIEKKESLEEFYLRMTKSGSDEPAAVEAEPAEPQKKESEA